MIIIRVLIAGRITSSCSMIERVVVCTRARLLPFEEKHVCLFMGKASNVVLCLSDVFFI